MKEKERVLYAGFGEDGRSWQKETLVPAEGIVPRLKSVGCGAFKGRERCGAELKPDSPYTVGESNLIFLFHTAAGPIPHPFLEMDPSLSGKISPRTMIAFLCERHQENPTLDMAQNLQRKQRSKQRKFIKEGRRKAVFGL